MSQPAPLAIENLAVSFHRKPLFSHLSLALEPQQFVTIMGENGAGKTVLVETLMGYHAPSAGTIRFWGKPFAGRRRPELNRAIGWVLSHREDYPPGLSIAGLFRILHKCYRTWDHAFVDDLVDQFQLDLTKALTSLSLGEQSKVKLIKALAFKPTLLVLDELTANLSPVSRRFKEQALSADDVATFKRHVRYETRQTIAAWLALDRRSFEQKILLVSSPDDANSTDSNLDAYRILRYLCMHVSNHCDGKPPQDERSTLRYSVAKELRRRAKGSDYNSEGLYQLGQEILRPEHTEALARLRMLD